MVQHLLLIMVAAPLFAIASPIELAWRSTTGTAHLVVTEALRSPVAKFLGHPAVAFVLYAVVIPVSHLTVWYNLHARARERAQRASTSSSCWSATCSGARSSGTTPTPTGSTPRCSSSTCSWRSRSTPSPGSPSPARARELFPAYFATHRTWGPSYVVDLHVGGSIMWVVGDTLMLWPMIPVALRWMHLEERKAVRIDRELDAQAAEEAGAGPSGQPPRSINSTRTPSGSVQ